MFWKRKEVYPDTGVITLGLVPAASHANTAREKIGALCAKPFKPKWRI